MRHLLRKTVKSRPYSHTAWQVCATECFKLSQAYGQWRQAESWDPSTSLGEPYSNTSLAFQKLLDI